VNKGKKRTESLLTGKENEGIKDLFKERIGGGKEGGIKTAFRNFH